MFYSTLERILKTFELSSFSWVVTVIVSIRAGGYLNSPQDPKIIVSFPRIRSTQSSLGQKLFVVWLKIQDNLRSSKYTRFNFLMCSKNGVTNVKATELFLKKNVQP